MMKFILLLARCLLSSANMANFVFQNPPSCMVVSRELNTGFIVLSLTWPGLRWRHKGLPRRTACASVNYTKGSVRKRSQSWTFTLPCEFLDMTCFCWRTFTSQMNFLKRGRHGKLEAVKSRVCVWVCVSCGWMKQKACTLKVVISNIRLRCKIKGTTAKNRRQRLTPGQQQTADEWPISDTQG